MLKISYIVNSVFSSRTYFLFDDEKNEFWIVDCGDVQPLLKRLSSISKGQFKIIGVLLTHVHYDHIYGLPYLTELFPEIRVYTNEAGRTALANERINMSRYHEDPINYNAKNVSICEDGDEIELFEGLKAIVHYTPGHNFSCLTYEIDNFLFTGDAYIPGKRVVTSLPGGDKMLAADSVEIIKKLAIGKTICSGHEVC